MALRSRTRQDALLAGWFLLLLGHVCPWRWEARKVVDEICLLPSDKGLCKAIHPRWYHDQYTETCKKFNWGGCGGNTNNFKNKKDCEQTCHVTKKNTESCLLPSDVGFCKAIIPRWYYDRYTKTCKEFDWGGCGGNDNNFKDEEDCEQTCYIIKSIPKDCRLQSDKGKCRGYYRRYFFNINTMKCEKFYYGGCKGNENRFFTAFSCMNYCLSAESIATLMGYSWRPAHTIREFPDARKY